MQPQLKSSLELTPGGKQVVSDVSPQKNFSPQNREAAEKKLLDWKGVQTRYTFSLKEDEVKEWMEQIIRTQIPSDSPRGFTDQLDDGTILCSLVNELLEGSIQYLPKRSERRVELFLEKCLQIGVPKEQLFEPDDLILHRNTVKVVYCLHSLAEICHQRRLAPFFQGTQQDRTKQREQWKEKAKKSLKTGQSFEGWKATKLISKIKEDLPLPPVSKTTLSVAALPVIDDVVDNVVVAPPSLENATSRNMNFSTLSNNNRTNILGNGSKFPSDDAAGMGLYYSPSASPRRESPRMSPAHTGNASTISDPMDISNLIPDPHGSMLTPQEAPDANSSFFYSFFGAVKNSFSWFWSKPSTSEPDVPTEQPASGSITPISDTPQPASSTANSAPSSYQSSPLRLPQTPPPSPMAIPSSSVPSSEPAQLGSSWSFSSKSTPASIFPSTFPESTSKATTTSSLPTVPWTAPSQADSEVPSPAEPAPTEPTQSSSFFSNWSFPFSSFFKRGQQPEELPPQQIETTQEEPVLPPRPSIQVNGFALNSTPARPEPRIYQQPKVVEPAKVYQQPTITEPTVRPSSFLEQPRIIPQPVVEQPTSTQDAASTSSSLDSAIVKLVTIWVLGVSLWGYSWTNTEAKYGVVSF